MPNVRLALAQTNPTVGDISGNSQQIFDAVCEAAAQGAAIVVFAEMALSGYPIEDLSARREFLIDCVSELDALALRIKDYGLTDVAVVVGHPRYIAPSDAEAEDHQWSIAQNTASVLLDGKIVGNYAKHHLPNYSVFDEYRNFVPGDELLTFEHAGLRFSTVICEDIWQDGGPVANIAKAQTDVALVLNGSPFELDKVGRRVELVEHLATTHNCAVVYVNLVGGQDDLVFDGSSFAVGKTGEIAARAESFKTDLMLIDITPDGAVEQVTPTRAAPTTEIESVWSALVLGLGDYVRKNGFKSVVLGLSGGIDSAVCAAIARDALGAEAVFGVAMPSQYSSAGSITDADDLVQRLGISMRTEPIEALFLAAQNQLELTDLAAENLQARIRGLILMGLSNSEGHLTLTTGNKTELAVGYSTIYGDSVGGFAPIKDVPKTMVWQLARWRNERALLTGDVAPIPESSITKPPSAELRPGQVDQDSLPEYDVLDQMLELYVNQHLSASELCAHGFDETTVHRVITLVDRAEWKRRQGAIGPKISGMAFGRDRRLPITNRFKSH
jgi:NAD+ synthase (glutamine-hydrolysing)